MDLVKKLNGDIDFVSSAYLLIATASEGPTGQAICTLPTITRRATEMTTNLEEATKLLNAVKSILRKLSIRGPERQVRRISGWAWDTSVLLAERSAMAWEAVCTFDPTNELACASAEKARIAVNDIKLQWGFEEKEFDV